MFICIVIQILGVFSQIHKHCLKHKPVTTRVFTQDAPANKPVFVKMVFNRSFAPKQLSGEIVQQTSSLGVARDVFRRLYSQNW